MARGISLVIPTWNGRHILEKFLPSVFEACKKYAGETEVMVVEDCSTDDTREFLQKYYPEARVLFLPKNRGYGYASNWGIANSKYDLIVLLNNDVWVKNDFLHYLPTCFDKDDIFAVRMRVFPFEEKDAIEKGILKPPALWVRGEFKHGFIYEPAKKSCLMKDSSHGNYAFSLSWGAFAADKKKWLYLGGFDELFYPFYGEETDVSYRAMKHGWKIIYEPKSIAYHIGSGFTISKANKSWYVNLVGERNRYFLIWKNITDLSYILKHFLFIPVRLMKNLFSGDLASFLAFFYALKWLPKVYRLRKRVKKESKLKDNQIFNFFSLVDFCKTAYLDYK